MSGNRIREEDRYGRDYNRRGDDRRRTDDNRSNRHQDRAPVDSKDDREPSRRDYKDYKDRDDGPSSRQQQPKERRKRSRSRSRSRQRDDHRDRDRGGDERRRDKDKEPKSSRDRSRSRSPHNASKRRRSDVDGDTAAGDKGGRGRDASREPQQQGGRGDVDEQREKAEVVVVNKEDEAMQDAVDDAGEFVDGDVGGGGGSLDAALTAEELQMMAAMGIPFGFDSTQGKHVEVPNAGAVKVKTTRQARQYMNRRGGFNRALPSEKTGEKVTRN